ncbi:MAG: 5-oxoprolinase subunit PxpA [Cyclobacterium sp.]|uniref:5-oxoprolinase subunit PxpA n=1 Tax=unclassified Cyclobacterium TaxID=2615055 RepID=UPI0013D7DE4E|nr:5-oxoprolinase subunit PxpA [Cyclobacterium sp. SYSU L10401]
MAKKIDINCDLGEGMPSDPDIMPYLGSCNIACGGHAGDDASIRRTIRLAKKYQVNIGAHPSYPDKDHFGRISLDLDPETLKASLKMQIERLKNIADQEQVNLHHIKFHGALYLDSLNNQELADHLASFLQSHYPTQRIYAPYGSRMARAALKLNIPLCNEVFADRRYASATLLLPRKHAGAVLQDLPEMEKQLSLLLTEGKVETIKGDMYQVKADTICIHGDHPKAVEIAKMVSSNISGNKTPQA